jgi:hypothetical protein
MDDFKFLDRGIPVLISRWKNQHDLNPYLMSRNPKTGQYDKGTRHLMRYPLYNMDMIQEMPNKPIILCDKEYDCDILAQTGKFAPVTYPGNQRKWRPEYNHYLEYKDVVILALNPDQNMEATWAEVQNRLMKGFPTIDLYGSSKQMSKSVTYIRLAADTIEEWIHKNGGSAALDKLLAISKPLEVAPDLPDLEVLSGEEQSLQSMLNKARPQDYMVAIRITGELSLEGMRHIWIAKIAKAFKIPPKKVERDVELNTPLTIVQEIPDPEVAALVEILCSSYPDDNREHHVYGPVQLIQQEIKKQKGMTLSYPRVGGLLKRLGIRFGFQTERSTVDPERRKWLTLRADQVDAMASVYGFERFINPVSVKEKEFEAGFHELLLRQSQSKS